MYFLTVYFHLHIFGYSFVIVQFETIYCKCLNIYLELDLLEFSELNVLPCLLNARRLVRETLFLETLPPES